MTLCGDRLDYSDTATSPAASLVGIKLLLNSVNEVKYDFDSCLIYAHADK